MTEKRKLIPKDIFGNEIVTGGKIVYITGSHGHTILNWCEVESIDWPNTPSTRFCVYQSFRITAKKYAEQGGWTNKSKMPMKVTLTRPTALIVGKGIEDYPS